MKDVYEPTHAEIMVAQAMDGLMHELMTGNLAAIGVCAARVDGEPAFFYLNKPDQPVLRAPLNRLLGLYEGAQQFKGLTNAPKANSSYRLH